MPTDNATELKRQDLEDKTKTSALLEKKAQAEAIYMAYLANKAKDYALANIDKLAFDPQQRVLIEVTLDDDDYKKQDNETEAAWTQREEAFNLLRGNRTPSTWVSLDTSKIPELDKAFKNKLTAALIPPADTTENPAKSAKSENPENPAKSANPANPENPAKSANPENPAKSANPENPAKSANPAKSINPENIIANLPQNTGSLIALQEEFHFHLALATRVYQHCVIEQPDDLGPAFHRAHQATMLELNKIILEKYAEILKENQPNPTIKVLNKALNKARKELTPKAHTLLLKNIAHKTSIIITPTMLKKHKRKALKHMAETTAASDNDLLHLDSHNAQACLIGGSPNTAHDRKAWTGENSGIADKQLITHILSIVSEREIVVAAHPNPRIQIRVPSLALKKGKDEDIIDDVAKKMAHIVETNKLDKYIKPTRSPRTIPKALVYNLFTAINDGLGDMGGNKQTQSAEHIIKGAHKYNKEQLTKKPRGVIALVQNISVNGFGDTLGYQGNAIRAEVTLMTEMALLHTLQHQLSNGHLNTLDRAISYYTDHLKESGSDAYFSKSEKGKHIIKHIKAVKGHYKDNPKKIVKPDEGDIVAQAKTALLNMMVRDQHMDHKYAKLFQSLSLFVEEASIAGCKSGNERNQSIMGRTAIFDSLLLKNSLTAGEQNIKALLSEISSGEKIDENIDNLNKALSAEYNENYLQTPASKISLLDQGGPAKVQAKSGNEISRNFAEENSKIMSNLQQSKASKMQAHKDLTKNMLAATKGFPKQSFASKLLGEKGGFKKFLGGLAIFLLTVVTGGIAGVAMLADHIITNKKNGKKTKALDKTLCDEVDKYDSEIDVRNKAFARLSPDQAGRIENDNSYKPTPTEVTNLDNAIDRPQTGLDEEHHQLEEGQLNSESAKDSARTTFGRV